VADKSLNNILRDIDHELKSLENEMINIDDNVRRDIEKLLSESIKKRGMNSFNVTSIQDKYFSYLREKKVAAMKRAKDKLQLLREEVAGTSPDQSLS